MLCGLAAGIKSPEKGSGVTLDKLGMLRDNLTGRLEAPGQGEAVRGLWPSVWAAFAATYKDGWRRLLQVALEELEALARRGLEKDAEGVDGSGASWHLTGTAVGVAFVDVACLSFCLM